MGVLIGDVDISTSVLRNAPGLIDKLGVGSLPAGWSTREVTSNQNRSCPTGINQPHLVAEIVGNVGAPGGPVRAATRKHILRAEQKQRVSSRGRRWGRDTRYCFYVVGLAHQHRRCAKQ